MEQKHAYRELAVSIAIFALLILGFVIALNYINNKKFNFTFPDTPITRIPGKSEKESVKSFASKDEFKQYLDDAPEVNQVYGFGAGMRNSMVLEGVAFDTADPLAPGGDVALKSESVEVNEPSRVSQTNVQIVGIDEPDIVKTDGKEIYYSGALSFGGIRPLPEPVFFEDSGTGDVSVDSVGGVVSSRSAIAPDVYRSYAGIYALDAFPPDEMEIDSYTTEDTQSQLLLNDDVLLSMRFNKIVAYDVSDPREPSNTWQLETNNRESIVTSRLIDETLYLVTRSSVLYNEPCPIQPLRVNEKDYSIACDRIYHPVTPVPVDATYTVFAIDTKDGSVQSSTSFVGSYSQTVVAVFADSIYITYRNPIIFSTLIPRFIVENADLFSSEVIAKAQKIDSYDISEASKELELQQLLDQAIRSSSRDEELRMENEFQNRMKKFLEERKRQLESTGIVRVDRDSFEISNVGTVPGQLLNQFSLDEHKEHLRVATTIGGDWTSFGETESVNDLYILSRNMDVVGSVENMGVGEEIYSVRFVGDKGYIVTFRQIDPFIVLDLSDPIRPKKRGELKIPGYSSYLHPLSDDLVLGIGKENSNVKISLFDVSDLDNPIERDKYELKDYWTDVQNTHHAFLADPKHEVFFMPGGQGGYVFSYKEDRLMLERAVSEIQAQRALYLDDLMYVIGRKEVVVLDEVDWEEVSRLELTVPEN